MCFIETKSNIFFFRDTKYYIKFVCKPLIKNALKNYYRQHILQTKK